MSDRDIKNDHGNYVIYEIIYTPLCLTLCPVYLDCGLIKSQRTWELLGKSWADILFFVIKIM